MFSQFWVEMGAAYPASTLVSLCKNVRLGRLKKKYNHRNLLTWRQQEQQQFTQARGRLRCIISCSWLSRSCISKLRIGPQHCRVQQSVSSTAFKNCWPTLFFNKYLLFISQPESTVGTHPYLQ